MRVPPFAALPLALALAAPLVAQEGIFSERAMAGGIEARRYDFDAGLGSESIRQVAFPFAAVIPLTDRFSVDVGTAYATTTVAGSGGAEESFSGLTDTQVRMAYVFGRDVVVASLLVNLPTGDQSISLTKFAVVGAASSNFLSFPVPAYGTGTWATGGVAAAFPAGAWTLGVAASARVSGSYEPFTDSGDDFTYDPGIETRLRLGVDRLVGSSRLTAGFTFSTFGTDDFRSIGTSTVSGTYQPGNRYIGQLALISPVGSGTVSTYAWDYYRSASGGTSGIPNSENVLTAGATGSWPLGPALRLEPLAEARFWAPEGGTGRLFGGGLSLVIPIGDLEIVPGGRFDAGSVDNEAGASVGVTGWEATMSVKMRL